MSPLAVFAAAHHTWLGPEEGLDRLREQTAEVLIGAESGYGAERVAPDGRGGAHPWPRLERQAKLDGGRRPGATTWKSWEPLREEVERVLAEPEPTVSAADRSGGRGGSGIASPPETIAESTISPLWFCYAAAQQRAERYRLRSPPAALEATVSAYVEAVRSLRSASPGDAVPPSLTVGDSRSLSLGRLGLPPADAVITSPPYAGVYDYLSHARETRARLRATREGAPLMGLRGTPEGRDWPEQWRSEGREMGARRSMRKKRGRGGGDRDSDREGRGGGASGSFVGSWDADQRAWLTSLRSNLRPGGRAALLVGDGEAGIDGLASTIGAAADIGLEPLASATISATASGARRHKGNRRREHAILLEAP